MVVVPRIVLEPAMISVPVPFMVTEPLPAMDPVKASLPTSLKITCALFVMLRCRLDVVPAKAPAFTIVPPE